MLQNAMIRPVLQFHPSVHWPSAWTTSPSARGPNNASRSPGGVTLKSTAPRMTTKASTASTTSARRTPFSAR
ncbi:hypothetical protein DPMN_184516 [Dreissena polymorpha]|uniref:Uncharacterized protein n=1 Tax=Dreissena polymorpha TaxID=45954 RepID=A0A9D4DK85_DREPO|nr:hypothetical protein DPMN_184516 [Dreissena polymorpha]